MPKYRIKFKGIASAWKTVEIKNEADPYIEANDYLLTLKDEDFFVDAVYVYDLKPLVV